jgi:probable F420-dependent oxidoreductase
VQVDAPLALGDPARAGDEARRLESLGFDGVFTFDGPHDPFLPLALAARATQRIELSTAIAVAFARSPMLLAQTAYDLHGLCGGRFRLGLGSQVRAHIERRFSQPWSRPAARMREFVRAIRAIWACWNDGAPLAFDGEFYTHTLMPPLLRPAPSRFGTPPIWLAGVGPRMTEVAGEVADGFLVHPFHTPEFLRETTQPALARGLARSGRNRNDLTVTAQVLVVSGSDAAEWDCARAAVRAQVGFYGSTPAYAGVLASCGREDLHDLLRACVRRGDWAGLGAGVDDELLETVAVCAPPDELPAKIRERVRGVAERVSLIAPWQPDPSAWCDLVAALHADL